MALRPGAFEMDILPPRSFVHGFFFFDVNHRYDWLPYAKFYVPDLKFMDTKQALLFFEVDLSTAPPLNRGTKGAVRRGSYCCRRPSSFPRPVDAGLRAKLVIGHGAPCVLEPQSRRHLAIQMDGQSRSRPKAQLDTR